MIIGNKTFDFKKRVHLMGILNATPDSFFDGGKHLNIDAALYRAEQMLADGADILDVGGESTRPGYAPVSTEEEIDRVVPVIAAIKKRLDVPVSVDTYKADVARAALNTGADMVNDIWGFLKDPSMAALVAERNAACVLMHNRDSTDYADFIGEVSAGLTNCAALAAAAGIKKDKIILDPGLGFGKTAAQSLAALKATARFAALGYPVLVAGSNKSFIGAALNLPVGERLYGTLAVTAYAALNGAAMVRVHEVRENKEVLGMMEAIRGSSQ
jgi:dihydropteroate synthase